MSITILKLNKEIKENLIVQVIVLSGQISMLNKEILINF